MHSLAQIYILPLNKTSYKNALRVHNILDFCTECWAMYSKGLEIPGYDPRAMKTLALGFAVGLRGACHNRSPAYEVDISDQINRFKDKAGRGSLVKEQEDFAAVLDSLIICKFLRKCFKDFYAEMAYLYSQATGLNLTPLELKTTGEQINNIKKAFNIREGWKRDDDWLSSSVA